MAFGSGSINKDTRTPVRFSSSTKCRRWFSPRTTSRPPSVVFSSRFSGTRQQACGTCRRAIASISSVAAISKLSGRVSSLFSRAMSASEMWRRSSRRCAVMPSAPASTARCAARSGSGWRPPRALRMVATWSMLTPRRTRAGPTARLLLGAIRMKPDAQGRGRPLYTRCAGIIRRSSKHPLHLADHRLALESGNDLGEVVEVPHLHLDRHLGKVGRAAHHAHVVDIAVGLADQLRDLGQRPRLVEGGDGKLGGKPLGLVRIEVPGHVDPALVLERLELGGVDLEDADALPLGQDTDDPVAGNGAALLEGHRHIAAHAADRQHLL